MFIFTGAFGWLWSLLASCAGYAACTVCTRASVQLTRTSARLTYCVLFTLSMISAWVLRDYSKPIMKHLPWIIDGHEHAAKEWFGVQAVYRISFGTWLFFAILSAALVGVRSRTDRRDQLLHHGNWALKAVAWALFNVLPFFLPNGLLGAYSWLARVGSGVFLLVQLVILLDFTCAWNTSWATKGDQKYLYGLLGVTVACYAGCLAIAGVLFAWFNPSGVDGGCGLNIALITVCLFLCAFVSAVSLHPAVRDGSLFPSAVVSLFIMYMCYSALASEPRDYACNGLGKEMSAAKGSTVAGGVLLTLLAVVYSALRAGSNTAAFFPGLDDDDVVAAEPSATELPAGARPLLDSPPEERALTSAGLDGEDDPEEGVRAAPARGGRRASTGSGGVKEDSGGVAYNYAFFHAIFALASMYIAMLMTGWGSADEESGLVDVGWASVWVKGATVLATAGLYTWSLVAPSLFPDRDFGLAQT
ncbi:unnamed protein product [Pedinophyceae sp. YPF-701]|nr:unnamed protein product [Pedinophyceae sp. YPF-701]